MKFLYIFQNLGLFTKSILVLLTLFFVYGLFIHFFDGVMPIHEWRKTDSLAFALNYSKGAAFLEPQTNFISNVGNRNAAAEFPIVYYIIGNIWRLFGQYEWLAKCISLGTLFTSIALFSKVVNYYLESHKKTLVFVGVIFSSPVLIYYSDTLLPNIYSFAFVLFSAYFVFQFLTTHKLSYLGLFFLFLTLTVLIKVTVLIVVLTFSGASFFYFLFHKRNLFSANLRPFLILTSTFILALFITFLWYSFAIDYNSEHQSIIFSTTIRPIWEVDAIRRKEIWDIIWKYQFDMLYHHFIMIPVIFLTIFLIIKSKISSFFVWSILLGLLGVIAYFILWFWVFDVHDYYLIEILFFPLLFLFLIIKNAEFLFAKSTFTSYLLSSLFIGVILLHPISFTQIAFGKNNVITKNTFFVSDFVKGNWGYFHWYHGDHLLKLQLRSKELQQIIHVQDTVLCLADPSPNIQLFTINRIGYTSQNFYQNGDRLKRIHELCRKGADYLLLIGPEPMDSVTLVFTKKEVFSKDNVRLYDLQSFKK